MNDNNLNKRLNRIEGQVKGLRRMLDQHDYQNCVAMIQQIRALQGALQNFAVEFTKEELAVCLRDKKGNSELQKIIEQLVELHTNF